MGIFTERARLVACLALFSAPSLVSSQSNSSTITSSAALPSSSDYCTGCIITNEYFPGDEGPSISPPLPSCAPISDEVPPGGRAPTMIQNWHTESYSYTAATEYITIYGNGSDATTVTGSIEPNNSTFVPPTSVTGWAPNFINVTTRVVEGRSGPVTLHSPTVYLGLIGPFFAIKKTRVSGICRTEVTALHRECSDKTKSFIYTVGTDVHYDGVHPFPYPVEQSLSIAQYLSLGIVDETYSTCSVGAGGIGPQVNVRVDSLTDTSTVRKEAQQNPTPKPPTTEDKPTPGPTVTNDNPPPTHIPDPPPTNDDPPQQDPPADDPPSNDPPTQDPPTQSPPSDDTPSDPPTDDTPGNSPPSNDQPPQNSPPSNDAPESDPPSNNPPSNNVPGNADQPAQPPAPITFDNIPLTPTGGNLVVGSQTITPGGPAVTHSGTPISLGPSATELVVGDSHIPITPPAQAAPAPSLVLGDSTITANPSTAFEISGETLTPGGQITVDGTTVSYGSSGVVVNGAMQTFPQNAAEETPAPISFGDAEVSANGEGEYVFGGQTLTEGGQVTVSGTVVSLASDGSEVVVGGTTQTLSADDVGEAIWTAMGGGPSQTGAAEADGAEDGTLAEGGAGKRRVEVVLLVLSFSVVWLVA